MLTSTAIETRMATASPVRLRSSAGSGATERPGFSGYLCIWNTCDSYGTYFTKGSFGQSLKTRGAGAPVLWQHNSAAPIGSHLAIREDDHGVFCEVALVDDGAEGSSALKRLRGGVPLGLSFGFRTLQSRPMAEREDVDFSVAPDWAGSGAAEILAIDEIMFYETSLVTFPANEQAGITAVRDERARLLALARRSPHEADRTIAVALALSNSALSLSGGVPASRGRDGTPDGRSKKTPPIGGVSRGSADQRARERRLRLAVLTAQTGLLLSRAGR